MLRRFGGHAWLAPAAALFAALTRFKPREHLPALRIGAAMVCLVGVGVMSLLFVEYLADRAEVRAARMAQFEARTRKVEDAQKSAPRAIEAETSVTASIIPAPQQPPMQAQATQRPASQGQATQRQAAERPLPSRPRRSSSFFAPSQAMADTFDDDPLANAPPLLAFAAGGSSNNPLAAGPMGEAGMAELPDAVEAKPESAERTADLAPQAAEAGRQANTLRAVTLRAGPAKGAKAIGVVPARTNVRVLECKSWCRISFEGRTGWVYKSFVGG